MDEDKNKIVLENKNQNQIVPYSEEFIEKTKEFKRLWASVYEQIKQHKTKHKAKKRKIAKDKYEDYLEAAYMQALLDKFFPGWSFYPAHDPIVIGNRLIISGGILEIIDEYKFKFLVNVVGVPPEKADYTRKFYGMGGGIYYFSKDTGNVIHESNPAKKAITEAFKYSCNRLTGIGNDTYKREEGQSLTLEQYEELIEMVVKSNLPEKEKQKAKKIIFELTQTQVEMFKEKLKEKEIKYAQKPSRNDNVS